MRQFRENQLSLTPIWGPHQHTRELQMIAKILETHPQLGELVQRDLVGERRTDTGRRGLSGDQVLRIALLKQIHGLSYRELEFHLQDSATFRSFVGLGLGEWPRFQTLQDNVKRIRPQTWEAIHRVLIGFARSEGIERGETIRADTTVVEANIHEPADSALLWDGVRVMTRILRRMASQRPSLRKSFPDRRRTVKRRAYAIKFHRRTIDPVATYRSLIRSTEEVCAAARIVVEKVAQVEELASLREELLQVLPLVECVIDQSRRRVLEGERVPANEKIVSIFEPHADILVKDNRATYYGHKVCLTGGKSSLVLDCVIEEGNPTDSTLVERTLARHVDLFGKAPRQVAMDGGFASKDNVTKAKALGVEDMAFHKKRGMEIEEMVRSAWVFRRLRDFRSGIEGVISTLKRAFQMGRCTWRGAESFKAYVWASVTSFNLVVMARHLLVREFA
ncbi:MAG: ISNCY family transposase [Myxococcota bacterium]